jgi:hypothetical protein
MARTSVPTLNPMSKLTANIPAAKPRDAEMVIIKVKASKTNRVGVDVWVDWISRLPYSSSQI